MKLEAREKWATKPSPRGNSLYCCVAAGPRTCRQKHRAERERTVNRKAYAGILGLVSVALGFLMSCSSNSSSSPPPPISHTTRYLVVSDYYNNRVLIYDSPFSTGESASVVLGQSQFTTSATGTTADSMFFPIGTSEDSDSNLYVNDTANSRVLQFKPPFANGMAASLAIGQPDFTSGFPNDGTPNASQNGLNFAWGSAFDSSGNLWVADTGNHRILEFKPPFATGMNASLVLGQANFTSNMPAGPPSTATTSSGLDGPDMLAFDPSGNLWVTDAGNSRVLEFVPPFANGMAASLVIGQPDFVSNGPATTVSGLADPVGIAFDGAGDLWIEGGNRVLEFKPPFANGMNASLVLGQASFTTDTAATTQNGMSVPFGIASDSSGNLYVADYVNDRTLQFTPPFSNDQNANLVFGQADFTTSEVATTATGQNRPIAVTAAF